MLNMYSNQTGRCFLHCLILTVWALPAFAQDHELDHQPLQRSPSLTYAEVLESALAAAPEFLASSAREGQVAAYKSMGRDLFAGNPILQTAYLDDSTVDNTGLSELEAGISIPLWRPGQKQQAQNLGQHYESLFGAWQSYLQWQVAGRMRDAILSLQHAAAMLAFERQSLANAEALEQLSLSLFDAGEVPELDLLSTRALVLDQRNVVYDAEAELVDAERAYQVVTGFNRIPTPPYQESMHEEDEISSVHPWLAYLKVNADVARSAVNQVQIRSGTSPIIGLGYRRERDNRLGDYIDTLGVSLSIPLGKSSVVKTAMSDARREEADLQVILQQARISLNQMLHEAEHEAYVIGKKLAEVDTKVELNQQRWEKSRLAYELAETNFYQVLMALEDLHKSEKERRSLELELQLRIAEINQSLGIMP
jgi:outer membrane protein TolC